MLIDAKDETVELGINWLDQRQWVIFKKVKLHKNDFYRTCEFTDISTFANTVTASITTAVDADRATFTNPTGAKSDKPHAHTRAAGIVGRRARQFRTMLDNAFRSSISQIRHGRRCITGNGGEIV